ncbi:phosphoglycolate phosphatase 1A, chloroplastic-like [Chrysoperla carnea]|uniref:phosphoglycolate phosphatase 1A, chloroplastic-like n=1 Tax=Chrysoperla carnea TaxID=189513 RepID=UPI001D07AC27|nr:phosphoglycolate phosphatase 1A, chloroplastic-like [Chrysoperla carnea]
MSEELKYKLINQLTNVEALEFINSFDSFLFDMDGVIFLCNDKIHGADTAINGLRAIGKNIHFVTNNSAYNAIDLAEKFSSNGIKCYETEFINTTKVIGAYLKRINFNKKLFVLGSQKSIEYFESLGYEVYLSKENEVIKSWADLNKLLPELHNTDVGAVIVDLDVNINYAKLCRAQLLLSNSNVLFLFGSADPKIPVAKNVSFMGFDNFLEMLKKSTGREPVKFAKPSGEMSSYVINAVKEFSPDRILFIGDSLHTDMLTAAKCGFKKLLVLSGATKIEELERLKNLECYPDYVANSLNDVTDLLHRISS